MNKFSYRDKEYAEYVYNNGFLTKYHNTELKFLALYLRDAKKITKKKDRKQALIDFCTQHIPEFNYVSRYKQINKALDYSCSKRNKLVSVDFVPVTKSECEYIRQQDITNDEKKLIFTLLVLHKLNRYYLKEKRETDYINDYFSGGTAKYAELKKISKVNAKLNINSEIVNDLCKKGLLTICIKGTIRLNFLDLIEYREDDEIVLEVRSYLNIGYYWELFNRNKRIGICDKCGGIFYKLSNCQVYCKECQGYEKKKNKILLCEDCGKEFEVNAGNMTKTRCDGCYKEYRRECVRENVAKFRKKHKM